MRNRVALILGALLAVGISAAAFGQGFQGGVRGSVKDSGGVVPGVEVTLTNEATNIKRTTVSNERGEYSFAALEPGTYALKATLQGYKTADRPGLRVGTQTFITMDLTMEVGAIEENVTVTGAAPLIETSNASTGTVLDSTQMQTLPSSGRAAFLIGTTVPTVIPSGDAQFNRQQDQTNASLLSLGGGTRRGNNYTLDGVPITDINNRAVANPTIESLDDVKVQVHTYDAEMGRTGGGVFNTTLRSGTNQYRGSAFFQTRPVWGAANNYFGQKAFETNGDPKSAKPATVYYLFGGAFGGPIVKDKTFFWFSSENYHDLSSRNGSLLLPTAAERAGDFSKTTAGSTPIKIYNPLTHVQFTNNQIPSTMFNNVALQMLKYLPMPQTDVDNGSVNYSATAQIIDYFQQEYTGKVEHKFNDKVSLTGFYLYNRTNEPCSNFYYIGLNDPNRFADPLDYILQRRPQIIALNNTWIPSDNSVLALRFGWTKFIDNSTMSTPFDAATLGFGNSFLDQLGQTGVNKFPQVYLTGYAGGFYGSQILGAINPSYRTYKSAGGNVAYSRFVGTHTYKFGADYRRIGVNLLNPGCSASCLGFGREFTSANGTNNSSASDGNSFATFLLGYPSGDLQSSGSLGDNMTLTTPLDIYTNYYGGYVQDDWRVSSKFTVNYGLRIEHEDGMHETNNNFTVGFDRTASSSLSSVTIPATVDPTGGTAARQALGGLMYAGVNGAATTQGNPPGAKWSPRVGAVYSLDTKTVIRGGYGLYWAPYNYPVPSATSNNGNYGQIGFTQNTTVPQSTVTPTVSLSNPFPNGLVQPKGNTLGLVTGAGTSISFVDQTRSAPRVQQYSVDVQRDLGSSLAMTVSYVGARGDHLPLGGTVDSAININQLDPKYLALGNGVLNQQVANPFFGVSAAGPFSTQATLSRAQLLRPYPQFSNVLMLQTTEGVNRYNAAVIELNKRLSHGWAGRFSYTYSRLMDNQFGESNFYTTRNANPINNFNYDSTKPACQAGMSRVDEYNSMCFDPRVDYSIGILDVPHRFIASPVFELPFGKNHSIGKSDIGDKLAGGWTLSSVITLQSGFPFGTTASNSNSNLQGNSLRPNLVPGVDIGTTGSLSDRLASADHPTATWVNPAAFATPAAGTQGNAPRTMDDVRTPAIINTDIAAQKNINFGNGKQGQFKVEVFNLFNRPQVNGFSSLTVGNGAFGQINTQGGFMRMTQLSFRFMF
ncbi:MAG TPA: carboxypeptidase-like regulatory domain-containing protein [Vicinamibacterales bacterium]|nr:carboxypeptidase-like regulatory domain-containing protein [Vicinamibacterales bacterium]